MYDPILLVLTNTHNIYIYELLYHQNKPIFKKYIKLDDRLKSHYFIYRVYL